MTRGWRRPILASNRVFTLLKCRSPSSREAFLRAWRGDRRQSLRCVVEQAPPGPFPVPEFDGIDVAPAGAEPVHADPASLDPSLSTRVAARQHIVIDRGRGPAKFMSILRRKQGTTPEQFSEYWLKKHATLVQREIEVSRHFRAYVQNHCVAGSSVSLGGDGPGRDVDGIVEIWFESLDSLLEAMFSNAYLGALRRDEANFVNLPNSRMLVVEEGGP